LYVTNYNWTSATFSVTVYGPGAHSNAAPIRTITGSNTGLNGAAGIALDGAGNLYVANSGANSVTVYAAGATGNAAPTVTIQGSNTELAEPATIARDAAGNLYVVSSPAARITVYAAGATGNATPTATIAADARPSFVGDWGIARDFLGNFYVTSPGNNTVTVYAAAASGHATPMAILTTVSPTQQTGYPSGIALDVLGELYVTNNQYRSAGSCCYPSVTVFAAGASGSAAPLTTISGSATGMNDPVAITRDASGMLYVANAGGSCCGTGNSITVYAPGTSGNAAPTATIVGTLTGLNRPAGLALDQRGNLYVANSGGNSITVYALGANGNASPTMTIAGSNTGLNGPTGIALDAARNVYVVNTSGNSITVYAAGASGNVAAIATIAGTSTGLAAPVGITF
jgi:sugar lactone lactonase YvrE